MHFALWNTIYTRESFKLGACKNYVQKQDRFSSPFVRSRFCSLVLVFFFFFFFNKMSLTGDTQGNRERLLAGRQLCSSSIGYFTRDKCTRVARRPASMKIRRAAIISEIAVTWKRFVQITGIRLRVFMHSRPLPCPPHVTFLHIKGHVCLLREYIFLAVNKQRRPCSVLFCNKHAICSVSMEEVNVYGTLNPEHRNTVHGKIVWRYKIIVMRRMKMN